MSAQPMTAQDIALYRLMMQQQQAPQIQPVGNVDSIGEGVALGAVNALNYAMQARRQNQALQQLQGLAEQQQAAKEAEALQQQQALQELASTYGVNPAATADGDLLRQLIVQQKGNENTVASQEMSRQNEREMAYLRSQLGVAEAVDKESQLGALKQQMEMAQRNAIADGLTQYTGDTKIGDYYRLTGDIEPVKTLVGADTTTKLFKQYGQYGNSTDPNQQNFFRSVFGFEPTTRTDIAQKQANLAGSQLTNEGKTIGNARGQISLDTENQQYNDYIKGVGIRDAVNAGDLTVPQGAIQMLGAQDPGQYFSSLNALKGITGGDPNQGALNALGSLQKENKALQKNQMDAGNELRRQKGLIEQDQFPAGSLYSKTQPLTGEMNYFATPQALQGQKIAPFTPFAGMNLMPHVQQGPQMPGFTVMNKNRPFLGGAGVQWQPR